jgi:hypothetical protein
MLARTISTLAVALVVGGALTHATPVSAQDNREEARTHFNRGVEAFEAGTFEQALDAFQEAYRLAPHPSVRVNMANCYERLGRPIEAIFHFQRFLAESESVPAAQRREVQAAVRRLEGQIGNVTFRVSPDGALVRIDGQEIRRAPIGEAVRLMPGSHTVEVRLDGYLSVRREFIVEGGQPADIEIRLERGTDPEPTPTEPTPTETVTEPTGPVETGGTTEGSADLGAASGDASGGGDLESGASADGGGFSLSTPTIIAGAATGALLVGTIIVGSLALGASSDFDLAVERSNDPSLSPAERSLARQDGLDAKDRADTLALVTDIMLVGTLLGAGATAFFLIQDLGSSGEERASGPRLRLTAGATPSGAGVMLSGEI